MIRCSNQKLYYMKPYHHFVIQVGLKCQAFWELFQEKLHGKNYDLKGGSRGGLGRPFKGVTYNKIHSTGFVVSVLLYFLLIEF